MNVLIIILMKYRPVLLVMWHIHHFCPLSN